MMAEIGREAHAAKRRARKTRRGRCEHQAGARRGRGSGANEKRWRAWPSGGGPQEPMPRRRRPEHLGDVATSEAPAGRRRAADQACCGRGEETRLGRWQGKEPGQEEPGLLAEFSPDVGKVLSPRRAGHSRAVPPPGSDALCARRTDSTPRATHARTRDERGSPVVLNRPGCSGGVCLLLLRPGLLR